MRCSIGLACAVALTTIAAGASPTEAAVRHSSAAKTHDWSLVVSPTAAGGFVMGNPNAKVKLIEYGSMTCPHCREFDQTAVPHLVDDYVKTGKVSWEFRNYVRDAFDVTASLVARCNGAKSFFPLTRGLFKDQPIWVKKVEDTPESQLTPLHDLPPNREFVALARIVGFQQWAAAHGVPAAKTDQCLSDKPSLDQLVQMAQSATTDFPDFPGTPTFVINGTMVDLGPVTAAEVWPTLRSKIDAALDAKG